ncbi:hypothetical protein [Streptomyces sp. NPDC020298]|uniref:hypothetical protein n=1 Tax=unclassified Streptomyces TaxID=2593676 RepID=UPI003404AF42
MRNNALHHVRGAGFKLYLNYSTNATTWSNHSEVPGLGLVATGHAPALATHRGKLYLAYRDLFTGQVTITTHTGSAWTAPVRPAGTTPDAPALAVRGDVLYCAIRGGDDQLWLTSLTGDSTTWSQFNKIPVPAMTISAPAIAAHNTDDLHFVYRSAEF